MKLSRRAFVAAAFALLSTTTARASSGGGGGGSMMREDMGRLLSGPLEEAQIEYWGRHQIPLYRNNSDARSILYESSWMPRDVSAAEAAAGVTAARNRVFMRGRMVEESMDGFSNVFRVTFTVENEIQTELQTNWHSGPMPDEARVRFKALYDDMMLELRTGVRR